RRAARDAYCGDGFQGHRTFRRRIDDQLAHFLDARIPAVDAADQDIDFLVAPRVAGGQFAADVRDHAVRDVPDGKPERGRSIVVLMSVKRSDRAKEPTMARFTASSDSRS